MNSKLFPTGYGGAFPADVTSPMPSQIPGLSGTRATAPLAAKTVEVAPRVGPVRPALEDLQATITRLNRRCQLADAALATKVEDFMKRSTDGLRNYYYQRNQELEADVARLTAERDALIAALRVVEGWKRRLGNIYRGTSIECHLKALDALLPRAVLADPPPEQTP